MPRGIQFPRLLRFALFLLFANSAKAAEYGSAAEIDWRARADLPETMKTTLPYFCTGAYVQPGQGMTQLPDPGNNTLNNADLVESEADDAIHIMGVSTTLIGNVHLVQGDRQLLAPRLVQDDARQVAEIDGPLLIREPNLLVTGEHATTDLFTGTGTIDQATFLLHESRLRGSASRLIRPDAENIVLDNATLTRCDPGSEAWMMTSDDIRLKPNEGYGTARNVTLRIKDVPLLYTPYIRFPLNTNRQSGFLLPSLGYDSDGGTDIAIPYYFNLAPNYDATYEFRSLWKRGFIHDGEFRFMNRFSVNEVNAAYLHDDDEYDDRDLADQTSSGVDTSLIDIPEFEKQDRWFLNLRHEGAWTSRIHTSLVYSTVSDIDYLHDIGGDVGSTTVQQFLNPVDSSLTNRRTAALDRSGQIHYTGDEWDISLLLQGFQNLDPTGAEQYESLPSITADWDRSLSIFDVDVSLNYTYFDKNNTDLTGALAIVGERAVADVEVALPYRKIWGFIKPSVGVIHRQYQLEDAPAGFEANPDETTGHLSVDAGLYFDRYFDFRGLGLQQTLEPRAYFLYMEHDQQDNLPQFDASASVQSYNTLFRRNRFAGYDRLGDARQFSLGLTTRFLSENTGSEFLSASIGQIYYLKDRSVLFQQKLGDDPTRGESALFTEARLNFDIGLSISGSYEWEPDVNRSNRGTLAMKYTDGNRRILNLNYIYTAPEIEQASLTLKSEESDVNFIWPVSQNWSAIGRWNFGWDDNRTIESFFGLEYNDCCWKSRLVWRRFLKEPRNVTVLVDDPDVPGGFLQVSDLRTPSDVGIFFEFQLKGLAMLGRRLDSLLEDAIPGYREREDKVGL